MTLDSHGEELLSAHLRSGRYHSPEEVLTRALETLTEKEPVTMLLNAVVQRRLFTSS